MKRQRGRSRRSGGGGNNPNRHFESNGPDVKIRGSAQQVLDKYLQYARDAQTSGDRVMSEAYFQHAEHYQRLLAAMQPKEKPRRDREDQQEEASEDVESKEANATESISAEAPAADQPEKSESGTRRRSASRRTKDKTEDTVREVETEVAADPLQVIDGEEVQDAEPKPRRRRTYKKREAVEADPPTDDDGVMKTLSRGRSKPTESVDEASDEGPPAPVAE
ncbi:MAG: DUF4167 domain-containing protein [Pseudomonadota bacterium]